MSKNRLLKQTENSKSDNQKNFKRRPIRKTENRRENDDDLQKSLSESEQSHSDEDEKDSSEGQNEKKKSNVFGSASSTFYDIFKKFFLILDYKKCALLLLLVLIVCCFYYFSMPVTEKDSFKERLKDMKNRFQNDTHALTFRKLENALVKVVNVTIEPSAPAIFTVAVNKNAIHKSHEFLHHLVNVLTPQNTVFINESKSWDSNPDDIKLKIDREIRSNAEEKRLFVVIVDNLQNLPIDGAMIFHTYCDHETAPFKQAVFFFVVPLNKVLPEDISDKNVDIAASKQLKKIWSEASPDKIDSLITRITVNVINIR